MLEEEREGAVNLSTPPKELFHAPIEIIHRTSIPLAYNKTKLSALLLRWHKNFSCNFIVKFVY